MTNLPTLVEKSETLQHITFNVGNEVFGVDIHCVEEIILPPKVTAIPRTPRYFLGITNLRGEVISVIDLRVRFGVDKLDGAAPRVIVILSRGLKLGMLVDKVTSIMTMDSNLVRPSPPLVSSDKQKYVAGSYKFDDNNILLLLNHQEIIADEDFLINVEKGQGSTVVAHVEAEDVDTSNEMHLVGFSMGLEFYALEGLLVEEIIEMPAVTAVPEMESFVEGIFHLRESVIPIIRLSDRLSLKIESEDKNCPVIIVKISGIKVGLIVEEITEVFNVRESEIEIPPTNLNKKQSEQLKGIIKMKAGNSNRVVMVLNSQNFLNAEEKGKLIELDERLGAEETEDRTTDTEEEVPILEFMIKNERFAILVSESNEIIPIRDIVPVPKSPPFIRGVINLRGDVISILDLPRLIKTESEFTEKTKILIVQPGSEVAGLIVDDLIGIKRVKLSNFEEPSELLKQKSNVFIRGIGKEEGPGDIVILMDLGKTLGQSQTYEYGEEEGAEFAALESGGTKELS